MLLAATGILTVAGVLYATSGAPPNTFVSGQPISSSAVNTQFQQLYAGMNALEASVAALQQPKSCPSGMVPVGDVCVDKYEATVWARVDGAPVDCAAAQTAVDAGIEGTDYQPFGETSDDYPAGFPDSGNLTTKLYACSIKSVTPSAYLTWFQAQQACVASGKHLITNGEWQAAVAGTPDPGGAATLYTQNCTTNFPGTTKTGEQSACVSGAGAFDLIGNLSEWVDLWGQAGSMPNLFMDGAQVPPWSANFGDGGDTTSNLAGRAVDGVYKSGLPAAAARGGSWLDGVGAGAFHLNLNAGPSFSSHEIGFRCAARRP